MSLQGKDGVYLPIELVDDLAKLTKAYLDPEGREVLNPVPLVVHTDLDQPLSIQQRIARILRTERFNDVLRNQGRETWEEANDFEVDDPFLEGNDDSPYTLMQEEFPSEQITKGDSPISPPVDGSDPEAPQPDETPEDIPQE